MTRTTFASEFSSLFQGRILRTQSLHVGTIPLVSAVLKKIGFHEAVERWCGDGGDVPVSKMAEVLVQARVSSSQTVPLSHVGEWAGKTMLPQNLEVSASKLNDSRMGRVLELVADQADNVWFDVMARARGEYDLDFLFHIYDVTSFYFEGEHEGSSLIHYGYNRDGKPGTKQVNVGLNVGGQDGIPLFYVPIPGNVNDTATVQANMEKLSKVCKALGLDGRPQVVGDRAMLTPAQMLRYKDLQMDYIGCMQNGTLQQELIKDNPDELLLLHPLPYVARRLEGLSEASLEEEKYYAHRVLVRIPVPEEGSFEPASEPKPKRKKGEKKKTFLAQALVVLACGKRRLDSEKREDQLTKTEARLTAIAGSLNKGKYKKLTYAKKQVEAALGKHAGAKGLIKAELLEGPKRPLTAAPSQEPTGLNLSLTWSRDDEAIQKKADLDGKYVVFFSDATQTDAEVFDRFKARDMVERRIGALKGAIGLRPIYLQSDKRILGLIFMTMVALLVATLIERQVRRADINTTIEGVQRQFSRYDGSLLTFGDYSQAITLPAPDKWQKKIFAALGVDLPPAVPVLHPDLYCEAAAPIACPWPTNPAASPPSRDASQ